MSAASLAVLVCGWGVVMGVAPLLQIRRIVTCGSSRDVSLAFLGVYVVGVGLWLAYGLSLRNLTIVVPNAVSLLVGLGTLVVAVRFRPPGGLLEGRSPDRNPIRPVPEPRSDGSVVGH